jgi:hypothetical protein
MRLKTISIASALYFIVALLFLWGIKSHIWTIKIKNRDETNKIIFILILLTGPFSFKISLTPSRRGCKIPWTENLFGPSRFCVRLSIFCSMRV